ncbi:MAG TPA: CoA-binding protein [Elusimicrobiales bacterium]|nr:CoA-binding protein [Elusimicrobiales bacterium]
MKQKYIAVVGVSANESKFGHRIFKDLLSADYNVDGVNIKGGTLFDKNIYRYLTQLPKRPDVALIVLHPDQTEVVVDECIKLNIPEIWMQPGAESQNAIEKAKKAGINVISKSCFMVQKGIW